MIFRECDRFQVRDADLSDPGTLHSCPDGAERVGMGYGKGILMIDAAKWFAKRRLLGVWRDPTEIHLMCIDRSTCRDAYS